MVTVMAGFDCFIDSSPSRGDRGRLAKQFMEDGRLTDFLLKGPAVQVCQAAGPGMAVGTQTDRQRFGGGADSDDSYLLH